MSKRSKRPAREARDIHATIRAQAAELKRSAEVGFRDGDTAPEAAALLQECRRAVEASIPSAVLFEGRRYYLRCRLVIQLDVFENPGDAEPLLIGAAFSTEGHGHTPGH